MNPTNAGVDSAVIPGNFSTKSSPLYNIYALYFPSKYRNPKVRAFVDFMVNELEDGPEWDQWIP